MASRDREFIYSKVIKISRDDMRLLRAGRKKCTIRLGRASVAGDTIAMSDGRTSTMVKILRVDNQRTFDQLTDADALDEGFDNRDTLIKDLLKYYPKAQPSDPITVIHFTLVEDSPRLFS